MKYQMSGWMDDCRRGVMKKPVPILSFPGAQLIGRTVEELVRNGYLQALCMQAIADRYDTGAAVSLMDLSVEAEAFGAQVIYRREEVPAVHGTLITDGESARALLTPAVGAGRTGECIRGIREAKKMIRDRPVLAGIIGPYSLAGRLLDMTQIMILSYEEPEVVEVVLEKAAEFLCAYATGLKEAGADGILMAEPAAGLLSPALIEKFSTPYVQRIRRAVEDEDFVLIYHNCGNITPIMDKVGKICARAYSVGNAIEMEDALKGLPSESLVMGNIDPAGILASGTPEMVWSKTRALLERCGGYENFVLSSGCDIPPSAPLRNLDAFFEAAAEFYEGRVG